VLSSFGYATILPIKKMNRAIKFYTETLGGKVLYRGEEDMKDSWAAVRIGKADLWLVTPEKWEKRELSYSVFLVKDAKKTVRELQKSGVKFEPGEKMGKGSRVEGPITYVDGAASAFFKDTEGNLLMIWQNNPPM
jgi:predicted enzyme related to lactoylglutathione lyase